MAALVYGSYTPLTVTSLQSLANDATDVFAGWQSERVDNVGASTKALDYEVVIQCPMANTSPANDQAGYLYVVPWIYTGSVWIPGGNFGTTTAPTGSEGTANISEPNSMKGPLMLPYKIAQQKLEGFLTISSLCGGTVPDGWSLAFRNCTGAALSTSCIVAYRALTTS